MLRLNLKPSYRYALLLGILNSLVIAIFCYAAAMPVWSKLLVTTTTIGIYFWYTANKILLWHSHAIVHLILNEQQEWLLIDNTGKTYPAQLMKNNFCSHLLIILTFKMAQKYRSCAIPIFSDMVMPDLFRRLKVQLKIL